MMLNNLLIFTTILHNGPLEDLSERYLLSSATSRTFIIFVAFISKFLK